MNGINSIQDLTGIEPNNLEALCTDNSIIYKKNNDRVLLTVSKKHALDSNISRCCSGLIFDTSDGKLTPLAVPPPVLNFRPKLSVVAANWNKYDQYIVYDGTIVTLYWYNGWKISSMNGYEVNSFKWQGDRTYTEVLTELFKKYPEFSLDKLSHSVSYTIGFRSADFHPFEADPSGIWLVQAYDLVNMKIINVDIGLPLQSPERRKVTSLNRAMENNNNALNMYFNRKIVHYGYILRSSHDLGAETNVLLESSLLRKIRQFVYYIPEARIYKLKSNHLNWCVLRAYLNYVNKGDFIRLFPKFDKQFREYDAVFDKLANRIRNILRNKNARVEALGSDAVMDRVALLLVLEIEKKLNINAYDGNSTSILRDFITCGDYIKYYYELIY